MIVTERNNSLDLIGKAFGLTPEQLVTALLDKEEVLDPNFTAHALRSEGFPTVAWLGADGAMHPLLKLAEGPGQAAYRFREALPEGQLIRYQMGFDGLDVVALQTGRGGIYLTRNEALISAGPTATGFVYSTPSTVFGNYLVPQLLQAEPVSIKQSEGQSLVDALNWLFGEVLGSDPAGHPVKVEAKYGFYLVAPPEHADVAPIISEVPITFYPEAPYSADLAARLEAVVADWLRRQAIADGTGLCVFDLTVSSALADKRPILRLQTLVYNR